MAQVGLHAYFIYQIRNIFPKEKYLFPSILFGAIIPDIDIIFVAIGLLFYSVEESIYMFYRTFSHSFIFAIFLYLIFSLISELIKSPIIKSIGKGFTLGILCHITLDTFLWFQHIQFLWPLPLEPFTLWSFLDTPVWLKKTIWICEFGGFYWYANFLINKHIDQPNQQSWIINHLQRYKLIEGIFLIFLILISSINYSNLIIIFGVLYIPSILIALWGTYMSRNTFKLK